MSKNDESDEKQRALDSFEHGGEFGPIEDRNERGIRLRSLPDAEREVAQEVARFADLCQYFERHKMDVPAEIVDQLGRASRLPLAERIGAMKRLNQRLMEYLNVGEDPGIWQ